MLGTAAAVVIGLLMIAIGSQNSVDIGPIPVFAACGALAYLINWIVFVPSNRAQTERYYDLTGSVTYLSLIAFALSAANPDARSVVVAAMVAIWALRLGTFLFRRVRRDGRDGRFDRIKVDPRQFFMTWTLQGLWVLLTLACALAIITGAQRRDIGIVGVIGIAVWLVGFAVEVVADAQKSAFKKDPANQGAFITTGLWAWSRHPNYFGEIVLWTGIAIVGVPVLSGWTWLTLVSPVFVALLLTRVSGIPLLEARAEKRWGSDENFRAYTRNTPVLIPRPPRG